MTIFDLARLTIFGSDGQAKPKLTHFADEAVPFYLPDFLQFIHGHHTDVKLCQAVLPEVTRQITTVAK